MIIIIGGSSGIGLKLSSLFLKKNKIISTYYKSKPKIKKRNIIYYKLNIESEREIKKFSEFVKKKKEDKIIVINLIGIYIDKIITNLTSKDFDKHYKSNLKSCFLLSKYFIPLMIYKNFGKLIFISSPSAILGHVGSSAYASTKAAILPFVKVLNKEYSKFNILSFILYIGYYNTGIFKSLKLNIQKKLIKELPKKKFSKISNIEKVINNIINGKIKQYKIMLEDGVRKK